MGIMVAMSTIDCDNAFVRIPASAGSFDGFCAWVLSDAYPERGRFSFVGDQLLVDMSPERLESHNQVKAQVSRVVLNLVHESDAGKVYVDGTHLKNAVAALSTEPDMLFVTWDSLRSGEVSFATDPATAIVMVGSPAWALEIVSDSSVRKDTRDLRVAYHRAGIDEYWLVDARGESIAFEILVREPDAYRSVEPVDGWLESPVFGRSFRLERRRDRVGLFEYRLEVR